ncbi:MAG TPA: hypothetical protein VK960_07895 [Acidimicrobiia bacterium]|nr:hypothetical protein [Acidimicrobiia bacterium]
MPNRTVHLVGTIPAASTREAMSLVVERIGDRIGDRLPDGETGDRENWIGRIIESLRRHPDLEVEREGDWSDYDTTPVFAVRRGHSFDTVDLDYHRHFVDSWGEFEEAKRRLGRPDLAMQIGIPGPIDLAFAAFGFNPIQGLRHSRPFEEATVGDIEKIHEAAGDEVVYQLEIPIEVEIAIRMRFLGRPGIGWLAKRILKVIEASPEGTRWGFHLCVGDMNHRAFSTLSDATIPVRLANALVKRFPEGRRLEFLHMPFAHAVEPPTTDQSFYDPLRALTLDGTRFVAGFVHEGQDLDTQRSIRDTIERMVGHPVDVAAACGLGRRDLEHARANLEMSRALAE